MRYSLGLAAPQRAVRHVRFLEQRKRSDVVERAMENASWYAPDAVLLARKTDAV
jgi:hypothetical protein